MEFHLWNDDAKSESTAGLDVDQKGGASLPPSTTASSHFFVRVRLYV